MCTGQVHGDQPTQLHVVTQKWMLCAVNLHCLGAGQGSEAQSRHFPVWSLDPVNAPYYACPHATTAAAATASVTVCWHTRACCDGSSQYRIQLFPVHFPGFASCCNQVCLDEGSCVRVRYHEVVVSCDVLLCHVAHQERISYKTNRHVSTNEPCIKRYINSFARFAEPTRCFLGFTSDVISLTKSST